MQEKKQKISPIKQRILQFIDTLNISKRDFYAKTGISRGTLESATGITEDTITKVFAIYPALSPSWIIMGVGEMLNKQDDGETNCNLNCNPNCNLSHEKQIPENNKEHLSVHPSSPKSETEFQVSDIPKLDYEQHEYLPSQQHNGMNDIIMNLVDRLNEQAEEIGALRHENTTLKYQLAKLAEDVGNTQDVPA